MLLVPNRDIVIPVGADVKLRVPQITTDAFRYEYRHVVSANNESIIPLPFIPLCPDWVEVFNDGFRILNPRVASITGGTLYEVYNVINYLVPDIDPATGLQKVDPETEAPLLKNGKALKFEQPITGSIKIICDNWPIPDVKGTTIEVNNVQGFKSARASLYIEPVVMTEPGHGYVRLSQDRQSMVYVPAKTFVGDDSFSYCLINNHGQYSKNYCVYVTVHTKGST